MMMTDDKVHMDQTISFWPDRMVWVGCMDERST